MKWKMIKSSAFLLVILSMSIRCTDQSIDSKQSQFGVHEIDTSDPLYQYLIQILGFSPADIVDVGEKYIAEGDIAFDKKTFAFPLSAVDKSNPENGRTAQNVGDYTHRVEGAIQHNIIVTINSNVRDQNIRQRIAEAVNAWNSVPCTELHFTLATSGRGHIEFVDDGGTFPDGLSADTDFPSENNHVQDLQFSGLPGRNIMINTDYIASFFSSNERKKGLFIHEIGHAVGFRHSDARAAGENVNPQGIVLVPETNETDSKSVFVQGYGAVTNTTTTFSTKDKRAIRNAYAAFTNSTCQAPLYYYWSPTLNDAFYTFQLTEKGGPNWNYKFKWIEGYINTSQVTDAIPIYRFYNQTTTDHALSTTDMGTSWRLERTFYIYPSATSATGLVRLVEYYSSSRSDHLYTTSSTAPATGGYVFVRVVGFITGASVSQSNFF